LLFYVETAIVTVDDRSQTADLLYISSLFSTVQRKSNKLRNISQWLCHDNDTINIA